MYTAQEIADYAAAEDVKFIRLAFCDVFGVPKNISIMPEELPRGVFGRHLRRCIRHTRVRGRGALGPAALP